MTKEVVCLSPQTPLLTTVELMTSKRMATPAGFHDSLQQPLQLSCIKYQIAQALEREQVAIEESEMLEVAHALKGTFSNIGALHLSQQCQDLEKKLKNDGCVHSGEISSILTELDSVKQQLHQYLE